MAWAYVCQLLEYFTLVSKRRTPLPADLASSMAIANVMAAPVPAAFAQGSLQGVNFYGDHSRANLLAGSKQSAEGGVQAAEARYAQALQFARQRESHVISHEQAHLSALGPNAASGINLEYRTLQVPMGNGITRQIRFASGGNVKVAFPKVDFASLDPRQPGVQQKLSDLKAQFGRIARGASAPGFGDMSTADKSVNARALAMLAQVQQKLTQPGMQSSNMPQSQGMAQSAVGSRFNRFA